MRVPFSKMYDEFLRVLLKAGFDEERATLCAKLFTESSLDGVHSHGLNRFPEFIRHIKKGYVDINASPEKVETLGSLERWDGNLGPGNLNAHFSMGRAVQIAKKTGVGCVALRNTNHWMRGGTYGWQAADAHCIAICFTNTEPNLPPWGGIDCRIGNNPFVIGVPREKGHIVLDMAMSQFSYGKMEVYMRKREMLPVYGGFDYKGNLTGSPDEIIKSRRPLPVGYWKGSGLRALISGSYLCTLPDASPPTRLVTSSNETRGKSPGIECIRQDAAVAKSRASLSVSRLLRPYIRPAAKVSPEPTLSTISCISCFRET